VRHDKTLIEERVEQTRLAFKDGQTPPSWSDLSPLEAVDTWRRVLEDGYVGDNGFATWLLANYRTVIIEASQSLVSQLRRGSNDLPREP